MAGPRAAVAGQSTLPGRYLAALLAAIRSEPGGATHGQAIVRRLTPLVLG